MYPFNIHVKHLTQLRCSKLSKSFLKSAKNIHHGVFFFLLAKPIILKCNPTFLHINLVFMNPDWPMLMIEGSILSRFHISFWQGLYTSWGDQVREVHPGSATSQTTLPMLAKVPQDIHEICRHSNPSQEQRRSRDCSNYRGISLLSIVGKLFARIVITWLQKLANQVYTGSRCGFRFKRSTPDMVFSLRQLQEKYSEQYQHLCIVSYTSPKLSTWWARIVYSRSFHWSAVHLGSSAL